MPSPRRSLLSALLATAVLLALTAGPAHADPTDDVTGDITAPELVALSLDPTTVDVTSGSATITARARFTDAGSGVAQPSFGWQSSVGTLNTSAPFTLVEGDAHDGVYTATMTVPAGAPAGEWPVSVQAPDRVGNYLWAKRADLEARGLPGHVDVLDENPDLTAPEVVAVELSASEVDVVSGPASLTLRMRLTDAGSGAVEPYIFPVGPREHGGGIRPPHLSLVEGTPQDGWWEGPLDVPQYEHAGTWSLGIRTYDYLLNARELSPDDLSASAMPTTFEVISEQDITPPSVNAAQLSAIELDVSDGDRELRLEASVVDDLSGLAEWQPGKGDLQLSISHPIGQWQSGHFAERLSGTPQDGTYGTTVMVPESSATGLWPLHLFVRDAIENGHSLTPTELAQLGLPPAVLVYNTPLPPLDIEALPGDAGAVVSWEPPADDRGDAVTEYVVRELPDGKVVQADGDEREVVVDGLTNEVEHSFAVYAVNRAGESDASTSATALPSSSLPPPAPTSPEEPVEAGSVLRLAGEDRIDTAIQVSHAGWLDGTADAVVLTRANDYADALAGTPLAAARNAPLLLTGTGGLDGRVREELHRVLPSGRVVYVLGGESAISRTAEQQVRDAGYEVVRLQGQDRFATAVRVAQQVTPSPQAVLLATGRAFADALGAGTAAASVGGVVLLTDGSRLPTSTSDYLNRHSAPRFAIGGPAAAADPRSTPLVGRDRYATALLTAQRFPGRSSAVGIATGERFADALAGGAHAARVGAPLLLTPRLALPEAVGEHLAGVGARSAFVYGGASAVDGRVLTRLQVLLGS